MGSKKRLTMAQAVITFSIGPGATNMITGAALALLSEALTDSRVAPAYAELTAKLKLDFFQSLWGSG